MQLLSAASKSAPTAEGCAAALLDAVPSVMWFVRRNMRRQRTKGLSVPQFRTLVLLRQYPCATLSLVAEQLGSTLPTASRMVAGLVARGFIARKSCRDDRRQIRLELTARGNAALDSALEGTRAAVAEKLTGLDAKQQGELMHAFATLAEVFQCDLKAVCSETHPDL